MNIEPKISALLAPTDAHPYDKWHGPHWRLVSLADLGVVPGTPGLEPLIEAELAWLTSAAHRRRAPSVDGRVRRCASQEGNAVYACSRLGYATDPRVRLLVESLVEWQWPDGGWNCDKRPAVTRSSFHETVTPALGLAAHATVTGDTAAAASAGRSAELLLGSRIYQTRRSGAAPHPSWVRPHFPAYWHYDFLQGLRLVAETGLADDPRAADAVALLASQRRKDGRFSGPSWKSKTQHDVVDWGRGADNDMLNQRVESVLASFV